MNPTELTKEGDTGIRPGSLKGTTSVSPTFITAMVTGIITLLVVIHIGFFHTYIKFFPAFEPRNTPAFGPVEFNWIMHSHGMIMMSWVIMLLVQPTLMRMGKTQLHRRVGRLSYVLAPLVVLSLYLANWDVFHRFLSFTGEKSAIARLTLTFPTLIFFAILYGIAMYYRHKPALHMRFMCSTAFLFIPPALDRALVNVFHLPGYDLGSIIQLTIIGAVVILDSVKTKRVSPFLLVFSFELLHVTLWHMRTTEVWQTLGGAIAKLL
jgi:uncharacterized membrane protein YozB (DUF420 family)